MLNKNLTKMDVITHNTAQLKFKAFDRNLLYIYFSSRRVTTLTNVPEQVLPTLFEKHLNRLVYVPLL